MSVLHKRPRALTALVAVALAGLSLQSVSPADAASRGGQGGFFADLLSVFAPPAPKPAAAAPQPVSSRRADPLYPYSGAGKAPPRQSPAYRTVCVRLCDGYYWPVSEAATEARFRRDSNVCESSCSQPAKLYYAPHGDSDASQFIGLDGKPYSSLETAFLYRKALQPQCQCKPGPWADSEIQRHKQYALTAAANQPQQVAMSTPQSQPLTPTDDPVPLPDTDGQQGNTAAVAADGALAARADPMPVVLRPTADVSRPIPAVAKARRLPKPVKAAQSYSDPLSFSVETIDRTSHRYIPRR